jgi:hypothetical protein
MKILLYLGHPAHYYLFKNVYKQLQEDGYEVQVLIKKKDILQVLLEHSHMPYHNILEEGRKDSKLGILIGTIKRVFRLKRFCGQYDPDVFVGTSVENSFVGPLRKKPVINVNEDDARVVPLYAKLSYPGASVILSPVVCDNGKWNEKSIKYASYHELAYLHPNNFTPDKQVVEKYFSVDKPYFIIRFAKLSAHHDNGIKGIDLSMASRLVELLKLHGDIYITSERPLEPQLEPYRIKIDPIDMHHVMAFASLYIGDSQTMAAEAGVLGVPFVRFNDFVGRIGYLNELENNYHLGFGIKASEEGAAEKMYAVMEEILSLPNRKEEWQLRRQKMLSEKIDYARFLTWFIENYPESNKIMKENPDYQYRFK